MTATTLPRPIAVYGAAGHTARFVLAELKRRGLPAVAVGRNAATLPTDVPARVAAVDDPAALDAAFAGCAAVINCAGPFLDTAAPVIEAALRAGAHYLDVSAEQASALDAFERFDAPARAAGVAVIPAAGFYGGLADLLATALLGADGTADELVVAVALDRWWPTAGTRITGERNTVPRLVVADGRLAPLALPAARSTWTFGAPHGEQAVVELTFSEVITISRHLRVRGLRAHLTASSLDEIRDAATPPPPATDALGRSAQRFEMVVEARTGAGVRRAAARGRDIYAVSAPLVVEAAQRLAAPGFARSGALALGQAVDAADFLRALSPMHLELA
ncbi:MAG: saccharopine dehydrogenase NADP-binding domain-containing protein [Vitreoscilla sp.]